MPQVDDYAALLATQPAIWLEALTELDGAPFVLEIPQIRFLNDQSLARLVVKSRQIGFSTVLGGEVTAKACTKRSYRANIVSINQEEANDKVTISSNLYHSIDPELDEEHLGPDALKPVLWLNSADKLGFHRPPHTSIIHSQPASSAVRGGRKDIYFDEAAHIRDFSKLYQAAYPATIRGDGRMTIISTPLGQSGLFYDIATDTDAYPEYSRHVIPWWESRYMVKPGYLEEAIAMAHDLDTPTRVQRYGTDKLMSLYKGFGNDIQAFMTEFEASFVDETTAFYTWTLIQDNVKHEPWKDIPPGWTPTGNVAVGVDLAKSRDETVMTVTEHFESDDEDVPTQRHIRHIFATQADYDVQFELLKKLVTRVKATRVTIDQTGVGQVFVEKVQKEGLGEGVRVEGVAFTNSKKEAWATRFKGDLQNHSVHLLRVPDLLRQIHGIQRTKSESGFYKFSGGSGAKRDDYFWSLMLSLYGEGRIAPRITSL